MAKNRVYNLGHGFCLEVPINDKSVMVLKNVRIDFELIEDISPEMISVLKSRIFVDYKKESKKP